jgi:hypothetical protein
MSSVSSQNHLVPATGEQSWRPKIAYVSAHLPSYLADEHAVVDRSLEALAALAQELDFELLADWKPVVTHDQASEVADEAEAQGADLVLLQSSSFAMGDTVLPFARRKYSLGLWATEEPTHEGPIALNSLVSTNIHAGILSPVAADRTESKDAASGRSSPVRNIHPASSPAPTPKVASVASTTPAASRSTRPRMGLSRAPTARPGELTTA